MASITDRPRKRSTSKRRQTPSGLPPPAGPTAAPEPTPKQRLSREQRRQAARKAGLSRRQLKRIYGQLPKPVHAVFEPLAPALTRPTYHRLVLLALAAILTVGGRTIANLLRYPRRLGPGPLQQLSPRPLPPPLALPPAGTPVHRRRPGSLRPPRPRRAGRRRHRHRTSRRQGLRQGLSSRPGPLHPLVHRVSLGAQVGRLGPAGPLPLLPPAMGPAADGGLVSARAEGDRWRLQAGAQDPGGSAGADAPHPDPLVPGPDVRLLAPTAITPTHELAERGRGESPAADVRQQVLPRCQPVRAAAAVLGQAAGLGRQKGKELPEPAQVVRDTPKRPVLDVAWYGGGRRRVEVVTGTGCVVSQRPAAGPGAVGLRPRPDRDAPG